METFDVVIGYNFFDVLFEFWRCEIRSSDPFPNIWTNFIEVKAVTNHSKDISEFPCLIIFYCKTCLMFTKSVVNLIFFFNLQSNNQLKITGKLFSSILQLFIWYNSLEQFFFGVWNAQLKVFCKLLKITSNPKTIFL